MQYSLTSRFRGTLLGAVLGGIHTYSQDQNGSDAQRVAWQQLKLGMQSLINLGRLDLEDWWHKELQPELLQVGSEQQTDNIVMTKAIVVAIPVALFYHEDELKLRQKLQQIATSGKEYPQKAIHDGVLAVGYAIAQSLNEKLCRADLISQTIAFLEDEDSQVAKDLRQVQQLLAQQASLARVQAEIVQASQFSMPIALAFYCFLSTIEDFYLSVRRSARIGEQTQLTSFITGALSGAYNGISSIPITWRIALAESNVKLAVWGIKAESEMLDLSDSLIVAWSGVYDQAIRLTETTSVAAPNVMRSR